MTKLRSPKTTQLFVLLLACCALRAQPTIGDYVLNDGDNVTIGASAALDGGNTLYVGGTIANGGTSALADLPVVSATITVDAGATLTISNVSNSAVGAWTGTVINTGSPINGWTGAAAWSGADGGAISVGPGSNLTLTAAPGGGFLFDSNTSTGRGGAIYANAGATVLVDSATFQNNTASSATDGGGAFAAGAGVSATFANVLFQNNTANYGGAIHATSVLASLAFDNAIFQNNTATTYGGVLYSTGGTSTFTFNNTLFQGNTTFGPATGGGGGGVFYNNVGNTTLAVTSATFADNALGNTAQGASVNLGGGVLFNSGNNATFTFTDVLFKNNSSSHNAGVLFFQNNGSLNLAVVSSTFDSNSAASGGAIALNTSANANPLNLTFTNVSFLDNTATLTGGILNDNNATTLVLTLATTTGNNALIAGNTAAGAPNSFYFVKNAANAQLNFTVDTQTGSRLDMLDPFAAVQNGSNNNATTVTFNKNGDGLWNLGGANTYAATNASNTRSTVAFNVNQGALHLYRQGETVTGYAPGATTGAITLQAVVAATAPMSFTLASTATLSIGGGNTISITKSDATAYGSITLDAGSIISYDLAAYNTIAGTQQIAGAGTALLSLTAATLNVNADTTTFNFGLDFTTAATGTYNLLQGNTGIFATNATNLSFLGGITGLDAYTVTSGITDGCLWISILTPSFSNNVLLWAGADSSWLGNNWLAGAALTSATFSPGDIVNLANLPAGGSPVINVDTTNANLAGMYVSGTENYTITGNKITTSATVGGGIFTGSVAATGKLILGATAAPDASGIDYTPAYTGTLALENASNNFTGGIEILSGALAGNTASLGSGSVGVTIASTGTLIFNQAATGTYTAPLLGSGALIKTNTAALTLNAAGTTFAGTTDINAGALYLAAATRLGGNIRVRANATLGGSGTVAGNIALDPHAILQVSGPSALSILGDLTLDGATIDYLAPGNQLTVGGDINLLSLSTLNVSATTGGTYALINLASGFAGSSITQTALDAGTLFNVTYNNILLDPSAYDLTLNPGDTSLWIIFFGVPPITLTSHILTWNRSSDTAWHNSPNWTSSGSTVPYVQNSVVNLAGEGGGLVTLAETATTAGMYVSGTASYALAGAGITATATGAPADIASTPAASGKLILGQIAESTGALTTAVFTGTLDLSAQTAANNFTGGVDIHGGALRIANAAQLGATLARVSILGSATLQAAANSNIIFDGSAYAAAENRLTLAASRTLAIALEDNSTMAFSNNYASVAGAAMNATSASLTLAAAPGAGYLFANNSSDQSGGAINASTSSLFIANATFTGNYSAASDGAISNNSGTLTLLDTTFTSNTAATNQGGAVGNRNATALLSATNVYFASNYSGNASNGGALFTGGHALITSATFESNTATNNGGAIANQSASGTFSLTDALIASNTAASNGGGYFASTQVAGTANTIASTFFVANTALGNYGGAIGINGNNSLHTLTDVSFYDNTSGTIGGAIGIYNANNAKLTIVATGTSRFAGNTNASDPNAINYSNFNNGQTGGAITINTTATGSVLDMLDPITADMSSANSNPNILTINKEGLGTWKLGGATNLSTTTNGRYAININAGTLYLYRAGEIVHDDYMNKDYTTRAASITMTGLTTDSFALAAPAILAIGGGNTIAAPTITLAANSTIAFDLTDALISPAPLLTLNAATTLSTGGWAQNLNLLNLDTLGATSGDIVNLISLGGAGAASSLFTTAAFNNLTNITGLLANYTIQTAPDGLSLFLLYTGTGAAIPNNVLTWTGAAATASWRSLNWDATNSGTTTTVKFTKGDIINLAGLADAVISATINVDTILSTTIAGMYVSGSTNYTLTGAPIVATAAAGSLAGSFAATGKLILGASAAPDASAIDHTPAFTGTLTLANTTGGSNNFTGGIEINTGALVGDAASLGSGTIGITIAAPATLAFDQACDATYAAPITGAGTLTKTNTGALTLAADNTAFTGATEVAAGSLLLGGSTPALGGSVHVGTGATFGGIGAASNVAIDTGATLQVGLSPATSDPALQTLNLSTLALSDGAILDYVDIAAGGQLLAGTLAHTGTVTINIDSFQSGTFNLGNLASLYGNAGITIAGAAQFADARQQAILIANGADLLLTAVGDISRIMIWTGSTNNTWALTGADWANSATSVFGNGDTVIFNDTAPDTALNIDITPGGVIVSDMIVDGTSNYAFTGGGITADAASVFDGSEITAPDTTGKLTKQNTGTLTLANAENNFLGGIDLEGGALVLSGTTHAGGTVAVAAATTLQMTGATLIADNLQFADSATLGGAGSITAATTLNGMVAASIADGGTLALAGTVEGPGGFLKTGAGELRFSNVVLTNTATMQIDEGAVRITATTPATAPLTTQTILLNGGGTLALGALTTSTAARTDSDTTARWTGLTIIQGSNPAAAAITGNDDMITITDSGTFAPALLYGLHVAVNPGAGNTIVLGNTANNFGGIVRVDSGTLQITGASQIGAGAGNTTKIALAGGALQISATNFALTSPNRDIELRAPENTIAVDDGINATLYRITRVNATIAAANLTKVGSGTLTVNAAFQATGLTVAEGRYIDRATNGTPANSGPVNICDGAVFEMNPTNLAATSTIGFAGGQLVAPGFTTSNPFTGSGTLEVNAGNISFTALNSDIAHINISGSDTALILNSFAPSTDFARNGAITVDQGKLILATSNQNLGAVVLNNGATLGFLMTGGTNASGLFEATGMPNRTATLASLAATGTGIPVLWFNTNVALGYGNHLAVNAPVSGTFAVGIVNYSNNALPGQYSSAIELIKAPEGEPGASAFNILTPEIDIDLYKYTVNATTVGGSVLVAIKGAGAMSNAASIINSMAAALPISWFSELQGVSQRMGGLHTGNRDEKAGISTWIRGYGEQLEFNSKVSGMPFDERHLATSAGIDYKLGGTPASVYVGAFFGYGQSQRAYNIAGDGSNESVCGGLYQTVSTKSGWYADGVLKLSGFKNKFTAVAPTGESASANYNNWAVGGSLEIGKYCAIGDGWFLEPQAQGAFTIVPEKTYATDNGMAVQLHSATIAQARAGFRVGRAIETSRLGTLHVYLKGYYGSQWMTNGQIHVTTPSGQNARYAPAITGETITGGGGIAWFFTQRTQLYFDYETTQADCYIKPWGFNLGVRHNW